MNNRNHFVYKIASELKEFEEIHSLNYETFVEEIPQHRENPAKKLVDKFHEENTYLIALDADQRLAGMLCLRDKRPFSLDAKLEDLDSLIPAHHKLCEIRLLAVKKKYRQSSLFLGLMFQLEEYIKDRDYDMVVISGTIRQLKLYQHMGFVPFGNLVGTEDAKYQPMFATPALFDQATGRLKKIE